MFFPERRPFFLENANYFETPINLFFSRRIRDPQFGARATGKIAGWAIGALLTARDFGASSNRIASIDSRIRLNKAWFFDGQGRPTTISVQILINLREPDLTRDPDVM